MTNDPTIGLGKCDDCDGSGKTITMGTGDNMDIDEDYCESCGGSGEKQHHDDADYEEGDPNAPPTVGAMVDAVNTHVVDHLVNGPVAHRDLMDAAAAQDAAHAALTATLTKINAIRNSIIGAQTLNWSEHVYPLVAALNEAGFEGEPFRHAAANVGTTLERIAALTAERDALAKIGIDTLMQFDAALSDEDLDGEEWASAEAPRIADRLRAVLRVRAPEQFAAYVSLADDDDAAREALRLARGGA